MRWIQVFLVVGALALAACGGGGSKSDGPVETWLISGQIRGDAVERVLLAMGGDGAYQIESDSFGVFTFPPVPPGFYSVTPLLDGVVFVPPNRTVQVIDGDITGVDFFSTGTPPTLDDTPPLNPVRLVFAHPIDGTRWLNTNDGALGNALGANNYYVRDVSLGWSTAQNPNIGSQTDIGHWYTWFADTTPQGTTTIRDDITSALYTTNQQTASYTAIADPGGDNEVVLIMSALVNSAVKTDNGQPPSALYGQPAANTAHTLPNCQEVYRQILQYFQSQPDKLFVVVTAAPLVSNATLLSDAANARTLNDWLVNDWLAEAAWEKRNVAVLDFFNILTDLENHHWLVDGAIQHINTNGDNFSAYGVGLGDSTVTQPGNLKGTSEFLPLLNVAFNRWQTWRTP